MLKRIGKHLPSSEIHQSYFCRYLQYLKTFDLSTGFYFSHTYDLTHTFQSNVVSIINDQSNKQPNASYSTSKSESIKTFNDIFMWNYDLILDFHKGLKNKRWVIGVMHGFLEQISNFFPIKIKI